MSIIDAVSRALGVIDQKDDDRIDYEFKSFPGDKPPKKEKPAETLLGSPRVTSEELSKIGEKYNVDLSMLRTAADAAESPIDDVTLGIPSWIYKKLQDEGGEAAISEINQLVADKQSGTEKIARTMIPSPLGKVKAAANISKAVGAAEKSVKELDELIDVPGLELRPIKKYGMDLWETWIAGKKVGQSQGRDGARSKALEWKRDNPDKLEKLIIKPEPTGRGTFIPEE
jgi:hypothetical protein